MLLKSLKKDKIGKGKKSQEAGLEKVGILSKNKCSFLCFTNITM